MRQNSVFYVSRDQMDKCINTYLHFFNILYKTPLEDQYLHYLQESIVMLGCH